MKSPRNVLYMKKHTQTYASYPGMDFKERGVDLEVEGVRYIDVHLHTGPASFKGRRSRTRGRSQCVLVKIWRSKCLTFECPC